MLSSSDNLIVTLLDQVDSISQQFVIHGYQNLVATYASTIYALIGLAVMMFGYGLLQGYVQLSGEEVVKRGLMWGGVLALALNWGNFSTYVYALFTKAPNEVALHMISAMPGSTFSSLIDGNTALQQAWSQGIGYAMAVWHIGGLAWFWAILLFMVVIAFTGIALFELIVAKFGLAIFLVLAPLVIPTFIFRTTKEAIFDGWFRHLVSFAFIPLFIYCALSLGIALLANVKTDIESAIAQNHLTIAAVAPYFMYTLVFIGLLIKSIGMATSMANGFSTGMIHHVANMAMAAKRSLSARQDSSRDQHNTKSLRENNTQDTHTQDSTLNNNPEPK